MKHFLHSFYGKISAVFMLLLLVLGCVQVSLTVQSCMSFMEEARHRVALPLAENIAREFEPHLADSIHHAEIKQSIHGMMLINPDIRIYLLSEDGEVLAAFCEPADMVKMWQIDIAPVHAYLVSPKDIPIRGDDPCFPDQQAIFTVAPVNYNQGENGYVYVLLQHDTNSSALDHYLVQASLKILLIFFAFVGIAGLIWFFLLTKRFNVMTEAVEAFEMGDMNRRINMSSRDEIGTLANAFDQMADTIVDNIEEMKEKDILRRNLIANISHDLRSPLTSIQGYLEMVLMKDDNLSAEKRQKLLKTIFKNTTQLSKLVGELFELSKLDARQTQPNPEPFQMEELAQDVLLKFNPRADELGVRLGCEFDEKLPRVYGDIGLIERALSNLIDNALHYTPKDGEVVITLAQEGERVTVTVSDTGMGIPEEDLPFVFDRFYRVEKSRTRAPEKAGAGLGLAITQKIIEAHNSVISVKSAVNKGTSFIFELPISA